MGETTTTPLIDVLLVLLIMFIVTIPLQSHAVKLDLPRDASYKDIGTYKNKIIIAAAGTVLWNAPSLPCPSGA